MKQSTYFVLTLGDTAIQSKLDPFTTVSKTEAKQK